MNVNIIISGACLFYPDPNENSMHVLLPASGSHALHVPTLVVDTAFLRAGSVKRDGNLAHIPFTENAWTIGSGGASPFVCTQVVNLRDIDPNAAPDPGQLGKDPGLTLSARVTLQAGKMTGVAKGHCWQWNGVARPAAHRIQWSFRTGDTSLTGTMTGLHGKSPLEPTRLFPIVPPGTDPADGELVFGIYHVTVDDLPLATMGPPKLDPGQPAPHFEMFHELLKISNGASPLYVGDGDACASTPDPCPGLTKELGSSPFTCVVAAVYP